jgi:hypothetical protein
MPIGFGGGRFVCIRRMEYQTYGKSSTLAALSSLNTLLVGVYTTGHRANRSEKTCSALNLPFPQSENMADMLEVTDLIRSKAVQPKLAMQSLKRRVTSPNGRVQMYALSVSRSGSLVCEVVRA